LSSILVVESDPILAAVIEDRLRAARHEVRLLTALEQIVAAATKNHVELLILDITQPEEAGLEIVTSLRKQSETQALPILVLSTSAESTDRVAALRAGVDDYLTKPCDLEELLLRAERLIGSRKAMAPVLQGDLANYPLWELMQYIHQAGKSGDLVLRGATGSGRIHLTQGKVYGASWEKLTGREALLTIFGIKQGTFRFVSEPDESRPVPDTEPYAVHHILMQAAWFEDELEKRRRYLPPTGMPLQVTGLPIPEKDDQAIVDMALLPLEEVRAQVSVNPGVRVFDLMKMLPRAPQSVRLAVACLVELGVLAEPEAADLDQYPSTGEIASSLLVEMAVNEFLSAARTAGFGTAALPFLILVEKAIWPDLLKLLKAVPGYSRNEILKDLVEQLKLRNGGSTTFASELGKLSLHVQMLTEEMSAKIESITTVCAGVLLWLDSAGEQEVIRRVIQRLESVKSASVGIIVAREQALPIANSLVEGTSHWRVSSHAPQTLFGIFRLLRPSGPG
jgi:DNA-binding response OmpR family regulator